MWIVIPIDDPREPIFKRFNTIYKTFRDCFGSIKSPISAIIVYGRVDVTDGKDRNNLNHPRVFAVINPEDRLTRWTEIDGRIQEELRKAFNEEILLPIPYYCREVQAEFASSKSRSDREFNNLRKELATRTRESGETYHESATRVSRLENDTNDRYLDPRTGHRVPHEVEHASTSNVSSLDNVASRVPKKPGNRQRGSLQVHETFTFQFLFPPCAEVGLPLKYQVRLRDHREHNHDPAHDMGTTTAVKDSRGELPVGTLGCYIRLKKPDGKLLQGTFGLKCHHVVSKFTSDASLPRESRLEITHPSQRDYENTIWTYEQRKGNLGLEIHDMDKDLERFASPSDVPPAVRNRQTTKTRIEREEARDIQSLTEWGALAAKRIGRVYATCGRRIITSKASFENSLMDRPWLADRALIEMREGKVSLNVVCFVIHPHFLAKCLTKISCHWSRRCPKGFDILRAHVAVFFTGSVRRDQIILHNGRNGMRFGKFEPTRLDMLLTIRDYATDQDTLIETEEVCIKGLENGIPSAYFSDSGAAIVNTEGEFIGMLHRGESRNYKDRMVYMTPREVLFDDTELKTGYRVV
ncbi:hypothetical protein OEA41_008916 [Lepraria neglecta]|uniref:Uncharacterized protein n=1 Tax=Lepraria neglecta TaxID=209136 RepID=A0AAD9Z399_9LECA|nr:hypothetical protein OEA41_008916 [Lepraria neglecta]